MFLKEKVVSDGQVRQFRGSLVRPHWSFSFPAPAAGGSISAGGKSFLVHPIQMENKPFSPQAILVAVNGSRSRAAWKEFISKTYGFGLPVYILTNEWFETADVKKAMAYLDDCEIPAFNLYPPAFPAKRKLGPVLWVTSGEEQSIPLGELRGSIRFANTQIAATERPADAVAVLNGRVSEYTASLIDLDRLLLVAQDEASTLKMLGDRRIQVPRETDRVFPLRASAIELEESAESASRPGSDLLVRMLMYRRIMRTLGQRFFNHDLDNADMVKLARDGMIVSPVSTLIVLESEADYKRFGIENDPSLLGQSKLEAPGAVPEPHELALLLLILLVIFYTRTRIRTAVHAHSR
jgi:XrtN system VIT domain protein